MRTGFDFTIPPGYLSFGTGSTLGHQRPLARKETMVDRSSYARRFPSVSLVWMLQKAHTLANLHNRTPRRQNSSSPRWYKVLRRRIILLLPRAPSSRNPPPAQARRQTKYRPDSSGSTLRTSTSTNAWLRHRTFGMHRMCSEKLTSHLPWSNRVWRPCIGPQGRITERLLGGPKCGASRRPV